MRLLEIHAMTQVTYDQARNISVEYIGNITVTQGRMGQHTELYVQPHFLFFNTEIREIKVLRLEHVHVRMQV